jgi:hypothetical protein
LARSASFKSESRRSCRVISAGYGNEPAAQPFLATATF